MGQKIFGFLVAIILFAFAASGQIWVTSTQIEPGQLFNYLVFGWLALDAIVVIVLIFSSSAETAFSLLLVYWISVVLWAMIVGDNLTPSLWNALLGCLLLFVCQVLIGASGITLNRVFRKIK